jgi:hypothetical protein
MKPYHTGATITRQSPILRLFAWLDRNQWACWVGLALCILAVGAIEAYP